MLRSLFLLFPFTFFTILSIEGKSLDEHLTEQGLKIEKTVTRAQKKQFIERLNSYPTLYTIAEVGLEIGMSAEIFFHHCKELRWFVSFDLNQEFYSQSVAEYFTSTYGARFSSFPGNPFYTLIEFIDHSFQGSKFDLIYLDGEDSFECVKDAIIKCKYMAHEGTILWINHVPSDFSTQISLGVKSAMDEKIIKPLTIHTSEDEQGQRSWAETKFHFGCLCAY